MTRPNRGGRPPIPVADRRVRVDITLAPETVETAREMATARVTTLSALIDALLREEIAALAAACPVIDAGHPATVEYELERVSWGEEGYDGGQSAYCVLVRHTIGTIKVASRYPLT